MDSGSSTGTTAKRGRRGSRGPSGDGTKSETDKPSAIYSIELLHEFRGLSRGDYMVPNHIDQKMAESLILRGWARKKMPKIETKHAAGRPETV